MDELVEFIGEIHEPAVHLWPQKIDVDTHCEIHSCAGFFRGVDGGELVKTGIWSFRN